MRASRSRLRPQAKAHGFHARSSTFFQAESSCLSGYSTRSTNGNQAEQFRVELRMINFNTYPLLFYRLEPSAVPAPLQKYFQTKIRNRFDRNIFRGSFPPLEFPGVTKARTFSTRGIFDGLENWNILMSCDRKAGTELK